MKKSKGIAKRERKVSGAWLRHLQEIAGSRSARKVEACRDNLAKARETKMMKRLGIRPESRQ